MVSLRGRQDVVVIGAGLAGQRAARDCAAAGRDVVVLEARDRVGGRAHTAGRAVLGVDVELGGTWLAPDHHEVVAECRRHGLDLFRYQAPTHVRWRTGGRLRHGMPVDMADWGDLERALATIRHDSLLDPSSGQPGRNVGPGRPKPSNSVDGVPVGSLASGRGEGLDWLYATASHGGRTSSGRCTPSSPRRRCTPATTTTGWPTPGREAPMSPLPPAHRS